VSDAHEAKPELATNPGECATKKDQVRQKAEHYHDQIELYIGSAEPCPSFAINNIGGK
jgi:hypothetical protein